MKKIKILFLFTLSFCMVFQSCDDNDVDYSVLPVTGLELFDPATNVILDQNNPYYTAFQIHWNDYDGVGAPYTISMSLIESFDTEYALGTSTTDEFTMTIMELNTALNAIGFNPLESQQIFIRVTNSNLISNVISLQITTFPVDNPIITAPTDGSGYVLDVAMEDDIVVTLEWSDFDFDASDTEVEYEIETALAGTNFAVIVSGGIVTSDDLLSWTHEELNSLALSLGILPDATGNIDIRVKSTIETISGDIVRTSDPITISVTTYTPPELPKLAVPGNHQGWNPPVAPQVAASATGATDYEGFIWLNGDYKFVEPDAAGVFAWGNPDWGDDGTSSGVLVVTGESNCNAAVAGYYYVQADTGLGTYSAQQTNWGLIGSATADDWNSDEDMTYDAMAGVWTITTNLTAEEIKFRANDDWTLNLGEDNDGDGSMNFSGPNIPIAVAGNYTITLDLSNPRMYTYTLTLN